MLRRIRHAVRVRLVEAVRDGAQQSQSGMHEDLAALRDEVRGLRERIDAVDAGLRDYMWWWERRQRRDVSTAFDQEALHSSASFVRAPRSLTGTPHASNSLG